MTKKLLSILPTRGRPARLKLALETFMETRTFADMVVVYDDDDTMTASLAASWPAGPVRFEAGPRLGLAQTFNRTCLANCHEYDVLGLTADDVLFRTAAWDHRFYQALAPRKFAGVVYGNDLIQGGRLCTHPYFGAVLPRVLGRIVAPGQRHLFMDNLIMAMGHMLGHLVYLGEVITEHQHCSVYPKFYDDSYAATNSEDNYAHDRAAFRAWLKSTLKDDIQRVLTAVAS